MISYDEFQQSEMSSLFQKKNSAVGYLKVIVSTATDALPLEGAKVKVYKDIGENQIVFFQGQTNSSGVIDDISLPCPKSVSLGSLEIPEYELYQLDVSLDGYQSVYNYSVGVFQNIKVIQDISMIPIVNIEEK